MTPEQQAAIDEATARLNANRQSAVQSFSPEQLAAIEKAKRDLEFQAAQGTSVMDQEANKRSLGGLLKQSAIKGVAGLGDVALGFPEDVKNLYGYFTTKGAPVPQKSQPVTSYLKEQGVITPQNEPNTPVLKAVDFTTQLATGGGINPYSMGKNLLTKPLNQAGKEIAGQFGRTALQGTLGSTALQGMESIGIDNPLVLAGGTMIPMATVGGLSALRGTPAKITNDALKNVTPEQLRLADLLLKQARNNGSPITGAEAIAQVTGQNPLQNVQRVVESSQRGGAIMSPFMANRPEANQQYFQNVLGGITNQPPSSQIPLRMQDIANQVVRGAESSLTQNVNPYYRAATSEMRNMQNAGKELMMPQTFNAEVKSLIDSSPEIRDAVRHVVGNEYTGAFGKSPTSPEALIAAKKYLDAQFTKFSNKMGESLDKEKAANAWQGSRELDSFLKSKSDLYRQGSNIYQGAQNTQINPLKQSGVGIMAEQQGTPSKLMAQQRESLMPNNPVALYPADIKRTVDLLRRKDPTVVPAWTAQNLEGIFNETAQNLQGGANQFGGAKFAATVTGNPQQKANLQTLITESAGPQAWQGFETFLDVMGAQGKRNPAGSQTAGNIEMQKEMKTGGTSSVIKAGANPFSFARNFIEDFRYGKNTEQLARMLTDPDSVNLLKKLSKTDPNSQRTQAIVETLAGGNIAAKPQEKE